MRYRHVLVASLAAASLLASQRPAEACGGCFVPPENNTVVTDHRMIMAIGQGKSTLYDQIRYQGTPESFAWVLPITGEAEVGLSADVVFGVLDSLTQVQVVAPPRNCPPAPRCDDDRASFSTGAAAPEAKDDGVTVTKREVVGPYETVQLQSTNAAALNEWLSKNGFALPADVKPVVAAYVAEHFNFLAMKLRPGATVQSMRPVRVTTAGPSVVLPLRMVAAGTGPVVGISLWVVGGGRYEPTNFPVFSIRAEDIAWDWTANASNFKDVRAQRTAATGGRGWELETSLSIPAYQILDPIRSGGGRGGSAPESDYAPIPAAEGKPGMTAQQVREADLFALLGSATEVRTTRLRADLSRAALSEDLVLAASKDQTLLGNVRRVTRELNEPLCPVYSGCRVVGQAPRSEAGDGGATCSAAPARAEAGLVTGLALALAVAIGAARRRRAGAPRP